MSPSFDGRAKFRRDVEAPAGKLLVTVGCRIDGREDVDYPLFDTASQWCVLTPDIAIELGYEPSNTGGTRLHSRFGLIRGELIRLPVLFVADEGDSAEVDATWFLSADWTGPLVIGWQGCLERFRFAFDPQEGDFFFAEY